MQVMQMEYRIQKDSIVAEIIKRTGSERPEPEWPCTKRWNFLD